MKKFNLLFLTLAMAFSFNSMAQVDVGCSAILNPANNDTLYANTSLINVVFTVKNYGDSIKANSADTLWMMFYVNGTFLVRAPRPSATGFPKDSSQTFTLRNVNLGPLPGGRLHNICIATSLKGDVMASNDTTCSSFYKKNASTAANLAISDVKIATPAPNALKEYKASQSLDGISLTLTNAGTTDLPAGSPIPIDITVGTNTVVINISPNADLKAGASITTIVTRAQIATLPNFPTTMGDFDVCCEAKYLGDSDGSNNKNCSSYKMVAAYTSVSEISDEDLNVFYSNDLVNISIGNEVFGNKEVRIINVSGQTVISKTISFENGNSETINVSSLPAGAYVVTIGGTTTKFVR